MKTCAKCGQEQPLTEFYPQHNGCKACGRAASRAFRDAHREQAVERCRIWRAANPDKQQLATQRWRENNAERLRAYHVVRYAKQGPARSREYYARHAEERRAVARQRRIDNPEKVRETQWRNRQKHPEQHATHEQTRNARLRGVFMEKVDHRTVFDRDGWICQLCMLPMTAKNATLDHIIPIARGGVHSYANAQSAHRRCNERKQDRMEIPHAPDGTGGPA